MSAPAKNFTELVVWQKAHAFVLNIYEQTATFPKHELYGLVSQFRRAAVSVPANIAEGFRKHSESDKARFLNIAEGSLEECRYYLILSRDLGYMEIDELWPLSDETARLLNRYRTIILSSNSNS